jgi:N6-adenosine-specific RNA methylase IME4
MSTKPHKSVFGVIYADPPWNYSLDYEGSSRSISNQYDTMTIDAICSMDVPAEKDCILYLWATAPLLPEALQVISAWGFNYKSCAVWDKVAMGMGYWFRGQHELLLVGVRGRVTSPPSSLRVPSVLRCHRGRHSAKPEQVRHWIEQWYPNTPKLEMFSRLKRPGWEVFGNQIEYDLLSGQDLYNQPK